MIIPKIFDDAEILVRFIFKDNFKKKVILKDKLNTQDIFLDTRLLGISLQRRKYTTVNKCKEFALAIPNKEFVGFALFRKGDFTKTVLDYKLEREEFESIIEFTPLDKNNQYLKDKENSNTTDDGNPSHSDIFYINPAIKKDEPTPNTSLRLFSKKLMAKSELVIDDDLCFF